MRTDVESNDPTRAHPTLQRLKEQAKRFGFTCDSTQWLGPRVLYDFVCHAGHALQRTAEGMLYGRLPARCPHCERAAIYKRLQILASWKGGTCLEEDFLGAKVVHRMRCAQGHEWRAVGSKLLAGNWCPTCVSAALAATRRTQAKVRRSRTSEFRKPISEPAGQSHGTK